MKTTNMNNTAIETAASEFIYVATQVRTEVWEERTEIDIAALECTDMATINGRFEGNDELVYVVKNLVTGEETTCDINAIRKWCMAQTLDSIADYRITYTAVWDMHAFYGKGVIRVHSVSP